MLLKELSFKCGLSSPENIHELKLKKFDYHVFRGRSVAQL